MLLSTIARTDSKSTERVLCQLNRTRGLHLNCLQKLTEITGLYGSQLNSVGAGGISDLSNFGASGELVSLNGKLLRSLPGRLHSDVPQLSTCSGTDTKQWCVRCSPLSEPQVPGVRPFAGMATLSCWTLIDPDWFNGGIIQGSTLDDSVSFHFSVVGQRATRALAPTLAEEWIRYGRTPQLCARTATDNAKIRRIDQPQMDQHICCPRNMSL